MRCVPPFEAGGFVSEWSESYVHAMLVEGARGISAWLMARAK